MYSRAEAELAAIEAERAAANPGDRPLLFFADAAGKELSQLRNTLKVAPCSESVERRQRPGVTLRRSLVA